MHLVTKLLLTSSIAALHCRFPPFSSHLSQHGVGSTITLQCPRGIVGRVIGKGGETIKGLQRKYHVSIQIDQGGDPMNVTITGPKHTSEACRQEVMALISDPMGPPFGDMGEWLLAISLVAAGLHGLGLASTTAWMQNAQCRPKWRRHFPCICKLQLHAAHQIYNHT
jgi:hypothetical protein